MYDIYITQTRDTASCENELCVCQLCTCCDSSEVILLIAFTRLVCATGLKLVENLEKKIEIHMIELNLRANVN